MLSRKTHAAVVLLLLLAPVWSTAEGVRRRGETILVQQDVAQPVVLQAMMNVSVSELVYEASWRNSGRVCVRGALGATAAQHSAITCRSAAQWSEQCSGVYVCAPKQQHCSSASIPESCGRSSCEGYPAQYWTWQDSASNCVAQTELWCNICLMPDAGARLHGCARSLDVSHAADCIFGVEEQSDMQA
jgi:hypothetical protein